MGDRKTILHLLEYCGMCVWVVTDTYVHPGLKGSRARRLPTMTTLTVGEVFVSLRGSPDVLLGVVTQVKFGRRFSDCKRVGRYSFR